MNDKAALLELKLLAKNFSLLYVEGNEAMLKSSVQFLGNFLKRLFLLKMGWKA